MTKPLVVIGGGGMGRCVLDVVDAINAQESSGPLFEVVGVLADPEPDLSLLEARGIAYAGPVSSLETQPVDVGYVIGIGDPSVRRRMDEYGRSLGRESPVLVHPNVHVGFGVEFGPGAIVCSHVSLECNIRIGRQVHINQNSTVGHDSTIGDWTTISPLVAVSGNVSTGTEAFLGAGASVRQRIRLGSRSVVGMGAAVTRDVDEGVTVVGVPAVAVKATPTNECPDR